MRHRLARNAGLLALLTTAALTACSSGSGSLPIASSALPSVHSSATRSVVVTVVEGPKKVANASTTLFICTNKQNCDTGRRVLSRGKTNAAGKVTLKGSFSDNDIVCAEAISQGSGFNKQTQSCQNKFPNAVTLDFNG